MVDHWNSRNAKNITHDFTRARERHHRRRPNRKTPLLYSFLSDAFSLLMSQQILARFEASPGSVSVRNPPWFVRSPSSGYRFLELLGQGRECWFHEVEVFRAQAFTFHIFSQYSRIERSGPSLRSLGVGESLARVGCLPAGFRPEEATVWNLEVCPPLREPQMPRGRRRGDLPLLEIYNEPQALSMRADGMAVGGFSGTGMAVGIRLTITPFGRQESFAQSAVGGGRTSHALLLCTIITMCCQRW